MERKVLPYCFAFNIPGEPRIANKDFLLSYIRFAAWLRLVGAYEQIVLLRSSKLDPARRMSAVATIYEKVGMQLEDVACTFIAWMCRARNKDLLLADLLNRIVLVRDSRSKSARKGAYLEECVAELCSNAERRVRVEMVRFFGELVNTRGEECLQLLGLEWKPVPSVKTARGDDLHIWKKLPRWISELVSMLADPRADGMAALFNKIKHGPQVVVVNLVEVWHAIGGDETSARVSEALRSAQLGAETLRVLLDGANTAVSDTHRSTIFVDDFLPAIEQVIYGSMFPLTKTMWWIAAWIAKREFDYEWEYPHPIQIEIDKWATRPR